MCIENLYNFADLRILKYPLFFFDFKITDFNQPGFGGSSILPARSGFNSSESSSMDVSEPLTTECRIFSVFPT